MQNTRPQNQNKTHNSVLLKMVRDMYLKKDR